MAVTLTWEGPVGPGAFPQDPLIFENLCQPGVYLRLRRYEDGTVAGGRTVAYVGQSVSLLSRFDQHLSAMLALAAPLRDAAGAVVFSGDAAARMDAYDRLAEASALAAADAARVSFYYALCDDYFHVEHLSLVEGLLQRRVAQRLAERVPGETAALENAIAAPGGLPDEMPDRWENDLSGLDGAGYDLLVTLLGETPMVLEEVAGHVF